MTACEPCWSEAFTRSRFRGGAQADHYRDLLTENETAHAHVTPGATCHTYWGSHGCDDPDGHPGTLHTCRSATPEVGVFETCSQYDSETGAARYMTFDDDDHENGWTEWLKDGQPYPKESTA